MGPVPVPLARLVVFALSQPSDQPSASEAVPPGQPPSSVQPTTVSLASSSLLGETIPIGRPVVAVVAPLFGCFCPSSWLGPPTVWPWPPARALLLGRHGRLVAGRSRWPLCGLPVWSPPPEPEPPGLFALAQGFGWPFDPKAVLPAPIGVEVVVLLALLVVVVLAVVVVVVAGRLFVVVG